MLWDVLDLLTLVSDVLSHLFFCSLSSNKGLCGVPTLPACPFFWSKGGLSDWAKIGIGIACLVLLLLLVLFTYMVCIRRGRHDYDFALPQDLICKWTHRPKFIFQFILLFVHFLLLLMNLVFLLLLFDISPMWFQCFTSGWCNFSSMFCWLAIKFSWSDITMSYNLVHD